MKCWVRVGPLGLKSVGRPTTASSEKGPPTFIFYLFIYFYVIIC